MTPSTILETSSFSWVLLCVHINAKSYTHKNQYTHIGMLIDGWIDPNTHIYIYIHIYKHNVYIYIYIICVCVYVCMYIHLIIYVYMYTYIRYNGYNDYNEH